MYNRKGPGLRSISIDLQYQNIIPEPVMTSNDLYQRAVAGDSVTIDSWRKIWIANYKAAKEKLGSLGDKSIGKLYGAKRHKTAICIASGPSLKWSLDALRENQKLKEPIPTVSCLHNFGFLEDEGIKADYYLTLDSGAVVFDDMVENRKQPPEHYWEKTKDSTLIAYAASDPKIWDLWLGDIKVFNCLVPDVEYRTEADKVERLAHYISSGGNAGGACMYFAKAVLGCNPIVYVGYDFCFDYANEFHAYKTKYDNWNGKGIGDFIVATDVFGNMRKTYPSYFNFKCFLDYVAMNVPGTWVNCSEGILGAYKEGNIAHYQYMTLMDYILQHKMSEHVFYHERDVTSGQVKMTQELNMNDIWANPSYENNVVLF